MKEALANVLDGFLPLPGVTAWAAAFSDKTTASCCYTDWLGAAQIEEIAARLSSAAENLAQHDITPRKVCWVFDHVRVHASVNAAGVTLAIFEENRPGPENFNPDSIFKEFHRLAEPA